MHRQNNDFGMLKEASYLKKKKDGITIRSSAAEYLTYVASVGDQQDSIEMRYIEMRYEDWEYMADPEDDGHIVWCGCSYNQWAY